MNAVAPYAALASVYDRWTGNNDYRRWASFITDSLSRAQGDVVQVLDACCGTGSITQMLQDHGYTVTGVDRSEPMLREAAVKTRPGTTLLQADLPEFTASMTFDAAVCVFDSMNYFAGPGQLAAAFRAVGQALRPGSLFIFDLNTRYKLETVFGSSHYGDDCGEYAYVWRNRYSPETRSTEFLISLFTQDGTGFVRAEERHVQRWFEHDEVEAAAHGAGFQVLSVTDDYTDRPITAETPRETWIVERVAGATT